MSSPSPSIYPRHGYLNMGRPQHAEGRAANIWPSSGKSRLRKQHGCMIACGILLLQHPDKLRGKLIIIYPRSDSSCQLCILLWLVLEGLSGDAGVQAEHVLLNEAVCARISL